MVSTDQLLNADPGGDVAEVLAQLKQSWLWRVSVAQERDLGLTTTGKAYTICGAIIRNHQVARQYRTWRVKVLSVTKVARTIR